MWRLTRAALDRGVSLVVFAEGSRTITGRVGPFFDGAFRMAVQLGVPITPVSIVGSFEFHRKTHWMLRPARIVVHLHDTIDPSQFGRQDIGKLRDRVWESVAAPVNADLASRGFAEAARDGSRARAEDEAVR
jgi:1-acyl-sn-glycerol-3-phosphate acyltransferase